MLCTIVGDLEKDDALLLVSFLMVSKSDVCRFIHFDITNAEFSDTWMKWANFCHLSWENILQGCN